MPRTIFDATRELCLSLPDTEEVSRHGAPNFKVKGKTFSMFVLNHHGDGRVALWLNSPREVISKAPRPSTGTPTSHVGKYHFFEIKTVFLQDESHRSL